jgi:hypothetical protein
MMIKSWEAHIAEHGPLFDLLETVSRVKTQLREVKEVCRRDQKNRHRSDQRQAVRQKKREQNGEYFTGMEPIAIHGFQRRGRRRRQQRSQK